MLSECEQMMECECLDEVQECSGRMHADCSYLASSNDRRPKDEFTWMEEWMNDICTSKCMGGGI